MRLALVLLVAVNLAVAAWGLWFRGTGPAPTATHTARAAPPVAAGADSSNDPSCYRLRPAPSAPLAERLTAELRRAGHDAFRRASEDSAPSVLGYWVYLPAAATLQEAKAELDELRSGGVRDAALAVGDVAPNTISLGVFRKRPDAVRRRQRVEALGIRARIAERRRGGNDAQVYLRTVSPPRPPDGYRWARTACAAAGSHQPDQGR